MKQRISAQPPQATPRAHQGSHAAGPAGAPNGALTLDTRLPARETVAGFEVGRETVAYPFSELRIARVVNDRVNGLPIVIVHQVFTAR